MKLPSGEEPVKGKHLQDLIDLIAKQSSDIHLWICSPSATGTTYPVSYAASDVTTELRGQMIMPRACTLQNFTIKAGVAGTSANRVRYTVRINGEDSACNITMAGTNTTAVTSGVRIPLKFHDRLSIGITRPDGSIATAPTYVLISWELI